MDACAVKYTQSSWARHAYIELVNNHRPYTTFISVLLFRFMKIYTSLIGFLQPIHACEYTRALPHTQANGVVARGRVRLCACMWCILCEWNVSPCVFVSFHCKSGSHSLLCGCHVFFLLWIKWIAREKQVPFEPINLFFIIIIKSFSFSITFINNKKINTTFDWHWVVLFAVKKNR